MSLKQMHASELDAEFRDTLKASMIRYPDAIGAVIYSNHDLGSPYVGNQMALPFGPSNTVKTLEHVAELRTYPFNPPIGSAWQYYPDGWVPRMQFFPEDAPPIPDRS